MPMRGFFLLQAVASVALICSAQAQPTDDRQLAYSVEFIGLPDEALEDRLAQLSPLAQNRKAGAETAAQLGRRVREDVAVALKLLRAEGYYRAQVAPRIEWSQAPDRPTDIFILVNPGPQFTFDTINVPPEAQPWMELTPGAPATSAQILAAEERLRVLLPENGYPFAKIGTRDLVVDHEAATVRYALPIDLGPAARFGTLEVEAADTLSATHVLRLARFRSGQPYRQSRVEDLRQALVGTGLFAEVTVQTVADETDPSLAHIQVTGAAAKSRSISVSLGYGTGEGPRGDISWQHRNLLGGEERLTILGRVATDEQALKFDVQKANIGVRDRVLLGRLHFVREEPDAYSAYRATLGGSLERRTDQLWQKKWVYALGGELELSDFTAGPRLGTVFVAALPVSLRLDETDDLFNPSAGFRVSGALTPELAVENQARAYLRADLSASGYWPVGDRFVFAGRLRSAVIWGASLQGVPTNRRLFAGGGGSIRGFGYQRVGPKGPDHEPTGGVSLTELSVETRFQVTPSWGAAAFVDAGTVRTVRTPSLNGMRFGAGLGVRYFAPFGPVRIDVATPLDRKRGENWLGVYVSVGQAF
jgi:translocation and assembly module TamA